MLTGKRKSLAIVNSSLFASTHHLPSQASFPHGAPPPTSPEQQNPAFYSRCSPDRSMVFARRCRGDEDNDGHRFFHFNPPPPHVDPVMVIRDALLSQLQKDRLRQEIILAELAKIERAMVLRNNSHHGIATDDAEWTKPVPFTFMEERWSFSQECYVDVDDIHDRMKKDGRHKSVELKSGKPATEYHVCECLRPCCNGKAGQENAKLEEQKLQESSESKNLAFGEMGIDRNKNTS